MSSTGVASTRETILERRTMVMDLVRRGLPEWLIAERLRISHRTVQRYKRQERLNVEPRVYPVGHGCSKPLCPLHKPGVLANEMVNGSSSDTP